jgi:MFS family permease
VTHGVYLIWWVQHKHVEAGTVALILAAGDAALTALEVPTGWIADRYGHRVSLLVGSLIQTAGMLMCWLGTGVSGLLAASLLVALGDAFRSGADQALLYRSCAALDREPDFLRLEARAKSIELVALVGFIVGGGILVQTSGFTVAWIVETLVSAAGVAVACLMIEPPPQIEGAQTQDDGAGHRRSWRDWISASTVRLILPASVLIAAASAISVWVQTDAAATATSTTLFVAMTTIAEAIGAGVAARLTAGPRAQSLVVFASVMMLGVGMLVPAALVPAIVALELFIGVLEPWRAVAIQRSAADHMRAQAASLASAFDKILVSAAFIGIGFVPRRR